MEPEEVDQDERGWKERKLRSNTEKQRERIVDIRKPHPRSGCKNGRPG
jgi:hypothetical protein